MTGMDTVTKPTIVVDYDSYADYEDVREHVKNRADTAHLVLINFDPRYESDIDRIDDVAWDMVILNKTEKDAEVFHGKAAKLIAGTALTPSVVFTEREFRDVWYAYGAAYVTGVGDLF